MPDHLERDGRKRTALHPSSEDVLEPWREIVLSSCRQTIAIRIVGQALTFAVDALLVSAYILHTNTARPYRLMERRR